MNPRNNWWEVYAPSTEEQQAADAGYWFGDVETWCKEKGVDFEAAMEKYKCEVVKIREETKKAEEESSASFSAADFAKKQNEFMALQKRAFEVAFRVTDDRLQMEKGQPSLTTEDTGVRWKNDPVAKT